jgi:N6-adenosine-specific RNA methylase IME4
MLASVILADPPWQYSNRGRKGSGNGVAANHYPTMTLEEIMAIPVGDYAAENAALFLWGTFPCDTEAKAVMKAWGFRYVTCAFLWVKLTKSGQPAMGTGHYTRANAEPCWLAIRGRMPVLSHNVAQIILAPRRQHSRKPDEQYNRIEQLYQGPYLELFAREQRPGWATAWSNEPTKFAEREAA